MKWRNSRWSLSCELNLTARKYQCTCINKMHFGCLHITGVFLNVFICIHIRQFLPYQTCEKGDSRDFQAADLVFLFSAADGSLFPLMNCHKRMLIFCTLPLWCWLPRPRCSCLWNAFPLKGIFKANASAITIISPQPSLHTQELGTATQADMWQLPQTKAPLLSSPFLFPKSPHVYRPACQGQLHPQPSVWGLAETPITTNKIKANALSHRTTYKHAYTCVMCVCVQTVCPLSPHPASPSLAHSEIITHFEWLWKIYSFFLRATKITGWQSCCQTWLSHSTVCHQVQAIVLWRCCRN